MRVFKHIKHVFFTGIGGIGMSGLAEILLESGYQVSGSDRMLSELTDYLAQKGATIYEGHHADNITGADALVYSSAVSPDNPERLKAVAMGIPVVRRAEMLAEVMRLKYGIAVAGTHGKTTTTSMCSEILVKGDLDPTVVVGGRLHSFKTNARLGKGSFFVTEADEYDRSFLALSPVISVITSIEADHLDCYRDLEDIESTFIRFAEKVPFYGSIIACADDPGVRKILPGLKSRIITYGKSETADYSARSIIFSELTTHFELFFQDKKLTEIKLGVPGTHNILNALAAIIVGLEVEIPLERIKNALADFKGVERRFEVKGQVNNILVIDDYAHHPTEVQATLQAARNGFDRRLIAVFQPHLFSRTRDFYQEFARALDIADLVFLTDIYPAREEPIPGITGELILKALGRIEGKDVFYARNRSELAETITPELKKDDLLITMGAGDIWKTGREILTLLEKSV